VERIGRAEAGGGGAATSIVIALLYQVLPSTCLSTTSPWRS
jgi:hypothetical protein